MVKANAPWRKVAASSGIKAADDCNCVISRDTLLAFRCLSLQDDMSKPHDTRGLRAASRIAPGLELPQDRESLASTAASESDIDRSPREELAPPTEPEEYQVLLQNLPKAILNESALRVMVKEAKLRNVKKVTFRADGKALITVTSRTALSKCIDHFNGLPWFRAPTCAVPSVTATHVQTARSRKTQELQQPAAKSFHAPKSSHMLSADAPAFVPGLMEWKASDACLSAAPSKKIHERAKCASDASTDGGLSSDEASCGYDSEEEAVALCVC